MLKKLRKSIANFIAPQTNSLRTDFLKYGSQGKRMMPDWTQVVISDEDLYVGYSYAAIRNRANATAQMGIGRVTTKTEKQDYKHPYLEIIDQSPTFSNHKFWYDISTYLDLEGIYYLMAVRAFDDNRYGDVQEFKLLNPYNIKRIVNEDTFEVGGYEEWRGSG